MRRRRLACTFNSSPGSASSTLKLEHRSAGRESASPAEGGEPVVGCEGFVAEVSVGADFADGAAPGNIGAGAGGEFAAEVEEVIVEIGTEVVELEDLDEIDLGAGDVELMSRWTWNRPELTWA
jgi:hypothetical protein